MCGDKVGEDTSSREEDSLLNKFLYQEDGETYVLGSTVDGQPMSTSLLQSILSGRYTVVINPSMTREQLAMSKYQTTTVSSKVYGYSPNIGIRVLYSKSLPEGGKLILNNFRQCSRHDCDHIERALSTFKHCVGCYTIYCSRECQVSDWSKHKKFCYSDNALISMIDAYFEKKSCRTMSMEEVHNVFKRIIDKGRFDKAISNLYDAGLLSSRSLPVVLEKIVVQKYKDSITRSLNK